MIKAIILGFIQAVTEFLPVSSSGHLRIAEYFLNFHAENILSFEVALHFGTFLATCLIFHKDIFTMTYYNALIIGIAQAIAVFPGISRSGMTISIALFLGLNRDFAGRFSFLISLPAIFGASLLSIKDIADFNLTYALLGFATAFIFGILALKLLMVFLKKGKLFYFGFYCMIVGMAVFIYFM